MKWYGGNREGEKYRHTRELNKIHLALLISLFTVKLKELNRQILGSSIMIILWYVSLVGTWGPAPALTFRYTVSVCFLGSHRQLLQIDKSKAIALATGLTQLLHRVKATMEISVFVIIFDVGMTSVQMQKENQS